MIRQLRNTWSLCRCNLAFGRDIDEASKFHHVCYDNLTQPYDTMNDMSIINPYVILHAVVWFNRLSNIPILPVT